MEINHISVVLVILSAVVFNLCYCARTSAKIYYDVDKDSTPMCFRRFNATHQIGCSSDRSGNVGVVYVASNRSDVDSLTTAETSLRFIILMNMNLFRQVAKVLIASSRKVRGVVILNINDTDQYVPDSFSPDLQCPNEGYGDLQSCNNIQWNMEGSGLMFEDYPFPVITLQNASVADFLIHECYEKHNTQVLNAWFDNSHLCGMLIKDIMDGAKDTPTCMRRSNLQISLSPQHYCEPLGNKNIFSSLRPMKANETNSVVIVAARLDAFSMFDKLAPGFESAVLSYVTLYAVAEAIGMVKQKLNANDTHILFVLFHGEAFDYIGSSRMVYDLTQGKMNFSIDDIKLFVEIGQVGLHGSSDELYVHTLNSSRVDDYINSLKKMLNVTVVNEGHLPPASLQSFTKERKDIAGLVIANHKSSFANRYYNSIFDKSQFAGLDYPSSLNDSEKYNYVGKLASHVQKLSTAVAQAIFKFANKQNEVPAECQSNSTTIANLLYCYAINSSCELFNSTYTNSCAANLNKAENVEQHYVGVGHGRTYDYCNVYMLANFLGDVVPGNNWTKETCENLTKSLQDGYLHYYVRGDVSNASDPLMTRGGRCIKTMANLSDAVSPAFIIDDYSWSSNKYSSWTESVWDEDALQVKIFMIPSQSQQIKTLVIGIVLLVISFIMVYSLKRKASVLFPATPTA